MAQEVDPEVIAQVCKDLEKTGITLFLQIKDRPPPKVGKPIVAAIKKITEAIRLLGGEG